VSTGVERHQLSVPGDFWIWQSREAIMLSLLERLIGWLIGFFRDLSPATKRKISDAIISILKESFREYYRQEGQQKASRSA
jgi:hypothetical protein